MSWLAADRLLGSGRLLPGRRLPAGGRWLAAGRLRAGRGLLALAAACAIAAPAQAPAQDDANHPLFRETALLELTLEAPLRALRRDSRRSRPEHDGLVRYTDAGGAEIVLDVEVRVRGRSRLRECDFPPLRLDFRRGQLDGTVFEGQNRLKLVTLCKQRDAYEDYLHLEYDIYRLFNALTDKSFRVRRVDVDYISTDSRREERFAAPAFLIEEDTEIAARHGLDVIEQAALGFDVLDAAHTALLSVFQYVIGNTDWSSLRGPDGENCCHNGDAIGTVGGPVYVIPYDFDNAGLIATDYAEPSDILPIRNVRQRLYRGFCRLDSEVGAAIEHLLERRPDLEAVIAGSEAAEPARAEALAYLRESLDTLADPAERDSEIHGECR